MRKKKKKKKVRIMKVKRLKSGWIKVEEGFLILEILMTPCKIWMKKSWREKPNLIVDKSSNDVLVLDSPIVVDTGEYIKMEQR